MKLTQFYFPTKGTRFGVLLEDQLVDLTDQEPWLRDTVSLLEECGRRGATPDRLLEEVLGDAEGLPRYDYEALDVPPEPERPHILMPVFPPEVWGFGVTYRRSAQMRDEDAKTTIYDRAYSEPRPEIFFKATASRCVGPNGPIGIRSDSHLTATEPELAYVLGADGAIVGFTACNDVSAWDIERENPLYLPQSKIYQGCCALGPVVATTEEIANPAALDMSCRIMRKGEKIYEGSVNTSQLKRSFQEMNDYLLRHNPCPVGTLVSTGTGIIVPAELALRDGDVVEIEIEGVGVLRNVARRL